MKQAKTSLILGIVSCAICLLILGVAALFGIDNGALAIIISLAAGLACGIVGITQSHKSKKLEYKGKMRKWGLGLSIAGTALCALALIGIGFLIWFIMAIAKGFAQSVGH